MAHKKNGKSKVINQTINQTPMFRQRLNSREKQQKQQTVETRQPRKL